MHNIKHTSFSDRNAQWEVIILSPHVSPWMFLLHHRMDSVSRLALRMVTFDFRFSENKPISWSDLTTTFTRIYRGGESFYKLVGENSYFDINRLINLFIKGSLSSAMFQGIHQLDWCKLRCDSSSKSACFFRSKLGWSMCCWANIL